MKGSVRLVLFLLLLLPSIAALVGLREREFWMGILFFSIAIISFFISKKVYSYLFYPVITILLVLSALVISRIAFNVGYNYFEITGEGAYGVIFGAVVIFIAICIVVVRNYVRNRIYALEISFLIFIISLLVLGRIAQGFGVVVKNPFM